MNNWLDIVSKLGPTVLAAVGMLPALIPIIIDAIQHVEKVSGLTGPEKKSEVLNVVGDSVEAFNVITKGPKLDPAEVTATASAGIDAVVGTVNIVHELQANPAA